ncbi:MAG: hypothetical protein QM765_27180 [Myxococcales bacterium]
MKRTIQGRRPRRASEQPASKAADRGGESAEDEREEDVEVEAASKKSGPRRTKARAEKEASKDVKGEERDGTDAGQGGAKAAPADWASRFAQHLQEASGVAPSTAKLYGSAFVRKVGELESLPAPCTAKELADHLAGLEDAPKMLRSALSQFRKWQRL